MTARKKPSKREALELAMEKASNGDELTDEEQELLAESEAGWDAYKDARAAKEDALRARPAGKPTHVHAEAGLVEVLDTEDDDAWMYRSAGDPFVQHAAKTELRPILSSAEASAVLARLEKPPAAKVPADRERREHLKRAFSLLDLKVIEEQLAWFGQIVRAGGSLWTMERGPFDRARDHLAAELECALGRPIRLPE